MFKQSRTVFLACVFLQVISYMICCLQPCHASKTFHVLSLRQQSIIKSIEEYFNRFRTLQARFTQITPQGHTSHGNFYLWRPGRMRLSYDSAARVVVCNGDTIYDHDPAMDELTEIPVDATPASFILRQNIRFQGDIVIAKFQEVDGLYHLSLVKHDDVDAGQLTLIFNKEPIALMEWEIIDNQNMRTRVMLDNIQTGIKLNDNLFKTNF